MKNLKLNFIETGRISEKAMNKFFAGWSCGEHTNCHEPGKNSCKPWTACGSSDTDKKTECNDGKSLEWVQANTISVASQLAIISPGLVTLSR